MENRKDFNIRRVTEKDHAEVYSLIQTAFETAKVKDGDEQDFAVRLRNGNTYIPALDLVAEKEGKLVGHIMLTHTHVTLPDGSRFDALLVAPLSVLLEYRDLKVGSALMNEGLRLATSLGYQAAFLVGDPGYYQRFGYRPTLSFGIEHPGIPEQYVMAVELIPHALKDITGIIKFC